jgi:RNA polymerase sigma-70 factor (ECF subfamily)
MEDEKSFSILVHRHTPRFHGLAWRICPEHAEDVLQEAFARLWAHPEAFDPTLGTRFTTWFSKVVVHLAIDACRRGRKVVPLKDTVAARLEDGREGIEEGVLRNEHRTHLEAAMKMLDPRQRAALALVYIEEIPQKEAATQMGLGLKAFESLLGRAKTTLRTRLETTDMVGKRRQR